jgi:hypothetical protein
VITSRAVPLLAILLLSSACKPQSGTADTAAANSDELTASVCKSLDLTVRAESALPPTWDACTIALRATMVMVADSSTLLVLRGRPMAPNAVDLQWFSESELGSATEKRFLSALLRLPRATHDVEVRFDSSGSVTYISAVHKPLQR